jgi:xanthine/uracil/vitamin C permease (AzgA family)
LAWERCWWLSCAGSISITRPWLQRPRRGSTFRIRSTSGRCSATASGWGYLAIILPLASLDTLASLQILESVKIAGDDYRTTPSLLMNGLGTLAAAAMGSPFPTTLYVGHAAHKANGARSGYSALNGLVTLVLCTTGCCRWCCASCRLKWPAR